MKLSRTDLDRRRESLLPQDGEHRVELIRVAKSDTKTGRYLVLTFRSEEGKEVLFSPLIEPKHKDLEAMALDHQVLLLDFLEAALGVEEVPELMAALKEAVGKPVLVETQQRQGRGRTRVNVTAFHTAPGPSKEES